MSKISNVFIKPAIVQKYTLLHMYCNNILARPVLSYESEAWTLKAHDVNRITTSEMRFMRTAGYTKFDHKRNEELRAESVLKYKYV